MERGACDLWPVTPPIPTPQEHKAFFSLEEEMASYLPFKTPPSLSSLYQSLTSTKTKDKVDMILEPLQAMIQLALLSVCPVGTKLRIQENILFLHQPTLYQPIARWYHSDKKDDVYFLYGVIKRYLKWYPPHVNKASPMTPALYQLVTEMAQEGLNQLFKTYSSSDSNTVIHVIQMYKNLLESNNERVMADEMLESEKGRINIDEVFEKIVEIYEPLMLEMIHPALELIRKEESDLHRAYMMEGLNLMLHKTTATIREWVKVNLTL
jgi:hypothetical protein